MNHGSCSFIMQICHALVNLPYRRKFVSSLCIFFGKAVTAGIKWKEHKELSQSSLKVIRNRKQMVVKKKLDKCIFVIFSFRMLRLVHFQK